MGDPDIIFGGFTFMLMCLGIGLMVAIIRWSGWHFNPRRLQIGSLKSRLLGDAHPDRLKALEVYRQLASEKLDVIKTAIAMGYNEQQMEQLDKRLEELIGADALKAVVRGEIPLAETELSQQDLESELKLLRRASEV